MEDKQNNVELNWIICYLLTLLISCASCFIAVLSLCKKKIERGAKSGRRLMFQSAVHFVIIMLFLASFSYCLFRVLFYIAILLKPGFFTPANSKIVDPNESVGIRILSKNGQTLPIWLSIIVSIGDTSFICKSLWMIVTITELMGLALKSMDSGAKNEKIKIKKYFFFMLIIAMSCFFGILTAVILNGGYNKHVSGVILAENFLQLIGLSYAIFAVSYICLHGRQNEWRNITINGNIVGEQEREDDIIESPIFTRIKYIIVIYMCLGVPYAVITLSILLSKHTIYIPESIIGIVTSCFYLMGAAHALVVVGSQACVFRLLVILFPNQLPGYSNESSRSRSLLSDGYISSERCKPPLKSPVFVYTDIEGSSFLWGNFPEAMQKSQVLHDDVLRRLLVEYNGYEITTQGDAFQLAFHNVLDATRYCVQVQLDLLKVSWPMEFKSCPITLHVSKHGPNSKKKKDNQLLFNGLRVRMGVHCADDKVITKIHSITRKLTYSGISEVIVSEVSEVGNGGQILLTGTAAELLKPDLTDSITLLELGEFEFPALGQRIKLVDCCASQLEKRRTFFKPVSTRIRVV